MPSQAPKALILRTLGTNCEDETAFALEAAGATTEVVHLNRLIEKPGLLETAQILVVPGGFSYGDDVAAGRIFGQRLRHALQAQLAAFIDGGGYVLGICNGFQVLVELGLLEGLHVPASERQVALTDNESDRYECRWVTLENQNSAASWIEPGTVWPCPVAHAEGKLVATPETVQALEERGQIALRYTSADGSAPEYPELPNGSVGAIAGLCDATGRVLGLMPHPERNVTPWHHPRWTRLPSRDEGEGLALFRGLVAAAARA